MAEAVSGDQVEPLLLSVRLAAERLGLSQWQVRQHFPIERVGKRLYVPTKALREYVEAAS